MHFGEGDLNKTNQQSIMKIIQENSCLGLSDERADRQSELQISLATKKKKNMIIFVFRKYIEIQMSKRIR